MGSPGDFGSGFFAVPQAVGAAHKAAGRNRAEAEGRPRRQDIGRRPAFAGARSSSLQRTRPAALLRCHVGRTALRCGA